MIAAVTLTGFRGVRHAHRGELVMEAGLKSGRLQALPSERVPSPLVASPS
jgi:hypothetical protein